MNDLAILNYSDFVVRPVHMTPVPLLIKLRQAVLRLSRLGIRTFVNGSLIRSPDAGKGQIDEKRVGKSQYGKLARMFMIHDSLWEVNVLFESAVLGWTREGTRGEDQFPVYVREESSHESVVLG